jgi:hypothetical protein
MKDNNQGTALMCSLLGCNTGRQIVPGVSKGLLILHFYKRQILEKHT